MSEGKRYTAGYIATTFPEQVTKDKAVITVGNRGVAPDVWYVDSDGSEAFERLQKEVSDGRVSRVVMRERGAIPQDVYLTGDFFEAAIVEHTELIYAEQRVAEPNEALLVQLLPVLYEWRNRVEAVAMREHRVFPLTADLENIRWLKEHLGQSDAPQAKWWLERLSYVDDREDQQGE